MAPAATPKTGGIPKKLGGVPTPVVAVVGAVIVGGVWYVRRKNRAAAAASAAAANSAGSTGGTAMATPGALNAYGPYDSSSGVSTDTLAAILASQGAGQSATAATPAYTPPTGEISSGAGLYQGPSNETPIQDAQGNSYTYIPNGASLPSLFASGQTIFYQPVPGIFAPATTANPNGGTQFLPGIVANTPVFLRSGG